MSKNQRSLNKRFLHTILNKPKGFCTKWTGISSHFFPFYTFSRFSSKCHLSSSAFRLLDSQKKSRTNIGNAKLFGLEKSLGMEGMDYNTALSKVAFLDRVVTC